MAHEGKSNDLSEGKKSSTFIGLYATNKFQKMGYGAACNQKLK